ncbi:MAG: hypothetical protein MUF61_02630 [archaeon]|jgi:hypothetical protein|nr:hypothetical protein [archaeon]
MPSNQALILLQKFYFREAENRVRRRIASENNIPEEEIERLKSEARIIEAEIYRLVRAFSGHIDALAVDTARVAGYNAYISSSKEKEAVIAKSLREEVLSGVRARMNPRHEREYGFGEPLAIRVYRYSHH